MFNIGEKTEIKGLEKIGCNVGHLKDCLHTNGKHEKPNYSYFGTKISRGTIVLHTKNGDFTATFVDENGWLKEIEIS